ncbi:hypothetical protein C9I98_13700 [Photobacterium sanctipauli]|uniref:Uncharacterized protein n=2 Tax=Photobacterium sanctipauli TaxID=1342794 RepID=A0A2T3NS16_9GAMM|nr:hypothetical protein C9I98_13700 [Photobacterium sanctipauli]
MTEDTYPEITHEESYKGYTIYIENNADRYRGGYEYTVSDGSDELDSGLVFTVEDGISEAKAFIDSL